MQKPLLIAIDGPSASGKGSLAKKLALHFKLPYLNTGALYRSVALRMIKNNITADNFESKIDFLIEKIENDDLENEELFSEKTGEIASKIAKNGDFRQKLIKIQRNFIENGIFDFGGAVLDGRDIASKIMPEANFKFFITANVEERAKRRFNQLCDKGDNVSYDEILAQLQARDENDKNRSNSPLVIDENSIIINNENLSANETFDEVAKLITKNYEKRN
jgi:cytidylate kinase